MAKKTYSLLIVDDEPSVHHSFQLIFPNPYSVHTALSGEEAFSVLRCENIDIVFLDINLPDKDGFAVLEAIKKFDPAIDVIMITADTNTKSAVRAIKSGAYDYITKPFDVEEVELIAERLISRRCTERALSSLREELRTQAPEGTPGWPLPSS